MNPIENLTGVGSPRIQGQSPLSDIGQRREVIAPSGSDFDGFLSAALDLLNETSRLEHTAQSMQLDYISGRSDDMLGLVLAEQRAQMALNFTVQVTSRVVEAYRQIISMQI